MNARCGRCGTSFAVPGPGRYACPGCGVTNEVRGAAPPPGAMPPGGVPPGTMPPPGAEQMRPPPPPDVPSDRVSCPECEFSFIVGAIAVATCPMCSAEVSTGAQEAEA